MANELTALPEFTRTLFKHAFILLPWYCRVHPEVHLRIRNPAAVNDYVEALRIDGCRFFGSHPDLNQANDWLSDFYRTIKPTGGAKANQQAICALETAWKQLWQARKSLQLRGLEIRLMKFFDEIFCHHRLNHLVQLMSMARLIDRIVVELVRSIVIPGGGSAGKSVRQMNQELNQAARRIFGSDSPLPEIVQKIAKRKPKQYQDYRKRVRDRREAARIRIIEMFDMENWFPIVDSAILYDKLRSEGIDDLLPQEFKGRVSVQPIGYPLTFYTYAGLELEKPPLHGVIMNPDYGHREPDRKYRVHPVSDGTYYCTTRAMVGDSVTKHYTLEYKRRARRIKYDSVRSLAEVIPTVRRRLIEHARCNHRGTWARAVMCMLMDHTCARIGNSSSAEGDNQAFGVTTFLNKKHVRAEQDRIFISYPGKHQQAQNHVLLKPNVDSNREEFLGILYDKVLLLYGEKREHLFTQENGKPFTPEQVNEYFTSVDPSKELDLPYGGAGSPCTVHNLRNYHATEMFRQFSEQYINQKQPAYDELLVAYQGRKPSKTKEKIEGILDQIAKRLGNTPAICRRAYIDPREQLLFFRRWGYRPPESITRDLFVQEDSDPYNLEEMLQCNPLDREHTTRRTQSPVS